MATKIKLPPVEELNQIQQTLFSDYLRDNPLAFVMWAFPWMEKDSRLESRSGPSDWQKRVLTDIADHIKIQKERKARGEKPELFQLAICSGRGIGKSALLSWLSLWMLSCHYGSTTFISANSDHQVSDVTFGEIGKWMAMSPIRHFFEQTKSNFSPTEWFAAALKEEKGIDSTYYYVQGRLWSEENTSGYAGPHSDIGMMLLYDEASGIPSSIWGVSDGFFTDPVVYRFWVVMSNPRAASGGFFDAFHANKSPWRKLQINSLDVKEIDHKPLLAKIDQYGPDSDEAAVEVYGKFPKQGDRQFISRFVVSQAKDRELLNYDNDEPLIMGVDPARHGIDATVFRFRKGRDARSIAPQEYRGLDNMQVVDKVLQAIHSFQPDHICIDSGAGAGIIDRLKQIGVKNVHEVEFGGSSSDPHLFDHRTEMWMKLANWLPGGMIDSSRELEDDLCNPEKEFVEGKDQIKLESKTKMKKRGINSPNHGDALALTFHKKWLRLSGHHRTSSATNVKRHKSWTKSLLG